MMKQFQWLSLSAIFFLGGCGVANNVGIHNRTNDYLSAETTAPLEVPADLQQRTVKSQFPVPAGEGTAVPVSIIPPGVFDEALSEES